MARQVRRDKLRLSAVGMWGHGGARAPAAAAGLLFGAALGPYLPGVAMATWAATAAVAALPAHRVLVDIAVAEGRSGGGSAAQRSSEAVAARKLASGGLAGEKACLPRRRRTA